VAAFPSLPLRSAAADERGEAAARAEASSHAAAAASGERRGGGSRVVRSLLRPLPLRAWHLHLPLITQESTGAPPGRSRARSDCISGPIFYLTPVWHGMAGSASRGPSIARTADCAAAAGERAMSGRRGAARSASQPGALLRGGRGYAGRQNAAHQQEPPAPPARLPPRALTP
jgi:hypothetical protein